MASAGMNDYFRFLDEGLDESAGEFRPEPFYSPGADVLFFYARDVPSYAKRLSSFITLILATDDDSLVGVKVKSVKRICERLSGLNKRIANVLVIDHKIKLGILLELALVQPADDPELEPYEQQLGQFGDVEIDQDELVGAC
jgi:hypothetical protein